MEGRQVRAALRARRDAPAVGRVVGELLGAGVPRVPVRWGDAGSDQEGAAHQGQVRWRDTGAEAEQVRLAVRRAYRRARRARPVVRVL